MGKVPSYNKLMWPTLSALKELGGSGSNSEIVDKIIDIENIPEEIQNIPHTNGRQTKLEYNIAWAKTYLKGAGAVENSERGVWNISDTGRKIQKGDILRIVTEISQKWAEARKSQASSLEGLESNYEDVGTDSSEEFDSWKNELFSLLQEKLSPQQFERLTQRILRESGFTDVEITGKSGDGGIDGFGILKIGLLSFKVIFQCKRYKDSVGPNAIRDFRGAMQGRAEKGLFVTTGTFTRSAKEEAKRDGAPPIDLLDGDDLCRLLKDLKLGIQTEKREFYIINKNWFEGI